MVGDKGVFQTQHRRMCWRSRLDLRKVMTCFMMFFFLRPTPINVLTSNPRQDIPLPKEWKKLSTMTFAFTHNQSGSLHGPLHNRLF